jgi:hypothetical protein
MSATENASYPMSNLLDYNPLSEWRHSVTTANSWLQIDFGTTARTKDYVIIDNHNLDVVGLKIESSDSSTFSSGVVTLFTAATPADNLLFLKEFTADVKRYIRITFQNSGTAPRIGNIFIGAKFQFRYPFQVGAVEGVRDHAISRAVSLNGVLRKSTPYNGRRRYEYQWKLVDNAEDADLQLISDYMLGGTYPCYLLYNPDDFPIPKLVSLAAPITRQRGPVYNNNETGKMVFEEWIAQDDLSGNDQYTGQTMVFSDPLVGA